MLNPNNDRLDYGEILTPPDGFNLDFAVGTTYSLDLDALVGASLAMGLSEETDSVLMNNPVCLLEALRSTGDKVALFCESGQIHLPNKVTELYILLEKMVFSVKTSKRKGIAAYPSFHPKFWLIRFKNDVGEALYRIVILSRNLTFDRSWDVSYYLDGYIDSEKNDKNDPVCDFLSYLIKQLPANENGKQKAKYIRELIKELPNVWFELKDKEFYDYEFIPNGITDAEGEQYQFNESLLFADTFHEILIMSPFISSGIIRDFNNRNIQSPIRNARYMFFTRESSLSRLKQEDVSNFEIYTLKDNVIDGETAISDGAGDIRKQDIHAKIFMVRKYSDSDLYLGSLNASHNAVYGNVEFMICLMAKNRHLNADILANSLFGGDFESADNPFQMVTLANAIITEDDDKRNALDTIIKNIARCNPKAYVNAEEAEMFSICVHFDDCDTKEYKVEISPLLSKKTEEFGSEIYFKNLSLTQLSEFYVVTVSDEIYKTERIIIIPTDGIPDEREKAVITNVVNDRDCFYRYIAFLLGDEAVMSILETNAAGEGHPNGTARQSYHIPALYEKMLQTAALNPDKFKGIDYLMKTISEDGIIPEDFKKLYETFKKVVGLND